MCFRGKFVTMKRKFEGLLLALCVAFISCGNKDSLYWTAVSDSEIQFYDENISLVNDEESGESFFKYSLFYKDIQPQTVNNVYAKTLGYDICGFDARIKFGSGAVEYFGFVFNLNTDTNNFYLLRFTPNGSLVVSSYDGSTQQISDFYEINASTSGWIKDSANSVKVQTLDGGSIEIYVNGILNYTILSPNLTYGALGVFEMLDASDLDNYSSSNPMTAFFNIKSIQHYSAK